LSNNNHNSTIDEFKKSELKNDVIEKFERPRFSTQRSDTTADLV